MGLLPGYVSSMKTLYFLTASPGCVILVPGCSELVLLLCLKKYNKIFCSCHFTGPKYSAKVEDTVVCGFSWKVLHFTHSWTDASSLSWNPE